MKPVILLLAVSVAALSSCTTAYKSGQTPDDVYFSPTRPQADNDDDQDKEEDKTTYNNQQNYEDRYLRMKVQNRQRWSELDDWYRYESRYNYTHSTCACICENPWTPSTYWNNYYNPYTHNWVIVNPKTSTTYNKPRTVNLNAYNNNILTNTTYSNPKGTSSGNRTYSAPRTTTTTTTKSSDDNSGGFLRNLFKSSNSSSNSSSSNSSSNSSSSSSSSSKSSSSSSAPVRRF